MAKVAEDLDKLRSIEELLDYQKEVKSRISELNEEHAGLPFPDEAREEYQTLTEENDEIEARVKDLRERQDYIRTKVEGSDSSLKPSDATRDVRPVRREREDIFDLSTVRMSASDPESGRQEYRDRAMRAVELATFPDVISREEAQSQVARLLENDSPDAAIARRVLITGSPTYRRAFTKYLAGQPYSNEEQRALSLTGASGGFAVPFTLDPTILNTSNGVVNPFRAISRVVQITGDEWRGVSSAGITAAYAAEATETTDNAPTLVQPTVSTEKAQAFVPFSIEISMDWGGLQTEMATLLQDAKDTLEAAKFATGTGTNEPFGVVTGTTNTIAAATGLTFTLANLYALRAALPARYRPRASWVANDAIFTRVRQFDTVGSPSMVWADSLQDDRPPRLLGKPAYEASEISGTITNAVKFAVYGDFSRYLIVDRIGLSVETIPHLFGANQRPTGQRGLYAYWRNGAKVLDANAFRAITGTT